MNFINKFFAKPYVPCMELHNRLRCYFSICHPSLGPVEGYNQFFCENHFLVVSHLKPEQDILQILPFVYSFDVNNPNIKVIKEKRKVYLPNKTYISLDENSAFVYDKNKLKISH